MVEETRQTARLRKFIRQPERHVERYGRFNLTARDVDVLELVFRYRHLTADHVRALIPGSSQHLTRRLGAMFHHGYLGRYAPLDRMRFELNAGSPVMAYGLDTKGWRALEQHGRVSGGDPEDVEAQTWRKEYTRRMGWFLEHHLGIADFHATLDLALRGGGGQGLTLREWDQGKATRGEVVLSDRRVFRVNPDAFFSIGDDAGAVRNYFLEFDSGSEEQRRIEAKFRAYWWWLQAPAYRDSHQDHERVAVLFVTTGEKRMLNMMETLGRMAKPNNPPYGGRGWFRFCLDTDYRLEEPRSILRPIWRRLATAGLDALV